ncbi:RNA polymerase II assembly factor RTP1 [Diplonema papillatum]|nr:RNA polymerase II assembly factor RTP1 [Diplonema papillatum]
MAPEAAGTGYEAADSGFFENAKRALELSGRIEEGVLAQCSGRPAAASEREVWEWLLGILAPGVALHAARGHMGTVLVGLLHLLHKNEGRRDRGGEPRGGGRPCFGITRPDQILVEQQQDQPNEANRRATAITRPDQILVGPFATGQLPEGSAGGESRPTVICRPDQILVEQPPQATTDGGPGACPPVDESSLDAASVRAVRAARRHLSPADLSAVQQKLDDVMACTHASYLIPGLLAARSPHQSPFSTAEAPNGNPAQAYKAYLNRLLDDAVMKPDGIRTLAEVLLSGVPSSEAGAYSRVVAAVVKVPATVHSAEQYVKLIAPQVISLWADRQAAKSAHLSAFTPLLVARLFEKHRRWCKRYVSDPVALPLLPVDSGLVSSHLERLRARSEAAAIGDEGEDEAGGGAGGDGFLVLFSAHDVVASIEHLHRISVEIVYGAAPSSASGGGAKTTTVFQLFSPVLPALLELHALVWRSPLLVKSSVAELLVLLLSADARHSSAFLLAYVTNSEAFADSGDLGQTGLKGLPDIAHGHNGHAVETCRFAPSGDGGVERRVYRNTPGAEGAGKPEGRAVADRVEPLAALLGELASKGTVNGVKNEAADVPGTLLLELLDEINDNADHRSARAVLRLALLLLDKGLALFKSGDHLVRIISFLLAMYDTQQRHLREAGLSLENDDEPAKESEELLTSTLTLLHLALTDKLAATLSQATVALLQQGLAAVSSGEPEIQQMITACRVGVDHLRSNLAGKNNNAPGGEEEKKHEGEEKTEADRLDDAFGAILSEVPKCLSDAPTAARMLISLKRLLTTEGRDAGADLVAVVERRFPALVDVLLSFLNDEESFVYLSCINTVTALCDVLPYRTMAVLLQHYRPTPAPRANSEPQTLSRARLDPSSPFALKNNPTGKFVGAPAVKKASRTQARDHRLSSEAAEEDRVLKLADIMVYCVWRHGEGSTVNTTIAEAFVERCHYRQTELVRASALEALASLSYHSTWAVLPCVDTVVQLAADVIAMDDSSLCKRGAASLLYHLFCGLGHDAVTVLQDHMPNILDIARRHLRDPDATLGEYCKLLLQYGNDLRMDLYGAPRRSLFSKPLDNRW